MTGTPLPDPESDAQQDPTLMPYLQHSLRKGQGGSFDFLATIERAKGGDRSALDELTERFYPSVEAHVHRELANDIRRGRPWLTARFSTCDIVQDVFQALLQDLSQFDFPNERAFVSYLAMVARNRILDALRFHQAARRDGRRTSGMPDGVDPRSVGVGPATGAGEREELERFLAAVAEFPIKEQLLLRERLERETPFHELAETLGYTSKWAASRAFYAAQAKLVIRLKSRGEDAE